jgi:hypothetical protein
VILILAQLQWLTLRGRVIRSIRLLRQPKYLVGAIAGFAWIALWVVRPLSQSHGRIGSAAWMVDASALMPTIHRVAAILFTLLLPLPWLLPWGRLGLPFREAELTLLLQAPLTRRDVIQYGLLKSEVGVVLSALLVSLFFPGRGPSSSWVTTFLGTWLLFEFVHLNGKWRALSLMGGRRRRIVLAIGVLALYVAVFSSLVPFTASVATEVARVDRSTIVPTLAALHWPPLLVALTTPAWGLTAPMLAPGGTAFLIALLPLGLAVVVQRELVLRSKARFEESALDQARRAEEKASPAKRATQHLGWTRTLGPFDLSPTGRPEVAVLWKNVLRVSRLPWRLCVAVACAVLLAIAVLPALLRAPDWTYGLTAGLGVMLLIVQPIFGGMGMNNDLRSEMAHLESVRTWPVAAPRLLLAEIASPALMSFAVAMFGAGIALASLCGSRFRQWLTGEATELHLLPRSGELLRVPNLWAAVLLFVSCVPLAAAVSLLASAVQNIAVLIMPAWMAHSSDRSRGVAAFGQRMLTSVALMFTLVVASLPSVVLVGLALFAQNLLGVPWSAWELPFWAVLAACPPFFLVWTLARLAAPLWERLDASEELLEIGR